MPGWRNVRDDCLGQCDSCFRGHDRGILPSHGIVGSWSPRSHVYTSLERLQSLLNVAFFVLHFASSYSVLMTNRYFSYDLEYACSMGAWKSEPSQNLRNNRACVCSNKSEIELHLCYLSKCYCSHSLLMNDDTCSLPLKFYVVKCHCKVHLGLVTSHA